MKPLQINKNSVAWNQIAETRFEPAVRRASQEEGVFIVNLIRYFFGTEKVDGIKVPEIRWLFVHASEHEQVHEENKVVCKEIVRYIDEYKITDIRELTQHFNLNITNSDSGTFLFQTSRFVEVEERATIVRHHRVNSDSDSDSDSGTVVLLKGSKFANAKERAIDPEVVMATRFADLVCNFENIDQELRNPDSQLFKDLKAHFADKLEQAVRLFPDKKVRSIESILQEMADDLKTVYGAGQTKKDTTTMFSLISRMVYRLLEDYGDTKYLENANKFIGYHKKPAGKVIPGKNRVSRIAWGEWKDISHVYEPIIKRLFQSN